MPMADFRSWLLRKDGGVEGRVADTRNCVGMEVRVCDSADVVDKIDELCSGVNVMYGEEEARVYGPRVECALGGTGASGAPTARPMAVSVDVVARTAEQCDDAEMDDAKMNEVV